MTDSTTPLPGRVGRGLGWGTAGNMVLRAGNLLVSIVVARLIAPSQFGVFAVALTVWSVLSALAEFGLGSDLIRSKEIETRIPTVATIALVVSAAVAAAMALSANPLAEAFDSPQSSGVIRLMSVSLLISGFAVVPAALLQRQIRQSAIFAINAGALVMSAATVSLLALAGFGPASLAWGQLVSQLVSVVAQYIVTRTRPKFGFNRKIARESAGFSIPLAFANLLSWVLLSVDNLIVARVMSPADLGLYVLAFNVSSWPMSAVGQAIRSVALPAFSHLGSQVRQNGALVRISGPLWAVSVLLGVLLATLADPLISFMYGNRWLGAVSALIGLAAFGALRVVLDLMATFLIAAGSTLPVLVVQVVWAVALVPSMLLGVGHFGLVGAGWAHVVVGAAVVLPAYLICVARLGVDWIRFVRSLLVPAAMIVPTAILSWWLAKAVGPPLLSLSLAGIAALVLFIVPSIRLYGSRIKGLSEDDTLDQDNAAALPRSGHGRHRATGAAGYSFASH